MTSTTAMINHESTDSAELPVVVIGAGPVGLAAAANLRAYGLTPLVFEAGAQVGAAMREWGHIRTFTPWQYIVDAAAEKLLAPTGWARPQARGHQPAARSSRSTWSRSRRCSAHTW